MRFGRSPLFIRVIGGTFVPFAAFLPVLCALVSVSMAPLYLLERVRRHHRHGPSPHGSRMGGISGTGEISEVGERRPITGMHHGPRSGRTASGAVRWGRARSCWDAVRGGRTWAGCCGP